MTNAEQVTAAGVQLMQGLAQRVTAARPALVNSDARPKAAVQAQVGAWVPSTHAAAGDRKLRGT